MSPVFTARRRAEEFATLVEDPSTPGGGAARYAELLDLVAAMQAAPAPVARSEFVADLREQLVAEAASATVPEQTARLSLPPRRRARERRIAAVVGGIAIVGASTSVAMASEQALPGDALYPVKRAIEDVHTNISIGDADKGHTVLANAGDRLDEVTALTRSGDAGDEAQVASTLDDFTAQATEASDLLLSDYAVSGHQASVTALREFAAASLDRLTTLEPQMPGQARDELVRAAKVVVAIDAAAHQACPGCGEGITTIPPIFAVSSETAAGSPSAGSSSAGSAAGPRHDGRSGSHDNGTTRADDGSGTGSPALPGLGQAPLPPGSVLGSTDGQDGSQPDGQGTLGSVIDGVTGGVTGGLTDGLQGGPTGQSPGQSPSSPSLGDTVDGTVDGLGDAAGDTVDGVTGDATGGLTGDKP